MCFQIHVIMAPHTRKCNGGLGPEEHAPSISKENSGLLWSRVSMRWFLCAGAAELSSGMDTIRSKAELSLGDNPVSEG